MNERTILSRYLLAEEHTLIAPDIREALIAEYLKALKVDIPVLNHLEASALSVAEEVADQRLWLVVMLLPEASLFRQGGLPARSGNDVAYARELQAVRAQMESAGMRTIEAIGDGRSPFDGVRDGTTVSSTRAVRARVRKAGKGGKVVLPAVPYGRELDVGISPKTLPRGPSIRIAAHIAWIEKRRARLFKVRFRGSDRERLKDIPGLGQCNELLRPMDAGHDASGELLRQAMDSDREVELAVVVELDWVSGGALRFELRACDWPRNAMADQRTACDET